MELIADDDEMSPFKELSVATVAAKMLINLEIRLECLYHQNISSIISIIFRSYGLKSFYFAAALRSPCLLVLSGSLDSDFDFSSNYWVVWLSRELQFD